VKLVLIAIFGSVAEQERVTIVDQALRSKKRVPTSATPLAP
jgi:hypothetical protein